MMLQLIDKSKFYFYTALFLILLSAHNINTNYFLDNLFKINKIQIVGEIDKNIRLKILSSLNKLYNSNIFFVDSSKIVNVLDKIHVIGEYKVKKEYPSSIKIELKETKILAYYIDNNKKIFIDENGKNIKKNNYPLNELPMIVGEVDIKNFLILKELLIKNGLQLKDFNQLFFFKSKRWDLVYKNKTIIKLPIDNLKFSLKLLQEMIKNQDIEKIKVIDLRIKDKVFLT